MARRLRKEHGFTLLFTAFVIIFISTVFAKRMFHSVESGRAAVLYDFFFGTDIENVYGEGFHVILPWNRIYIYDVREQELTEEANVLSYNGLDIKVLFSFRYRPEAESLGRLHQNLGPNYVDKVVRPLLVAAVREVIGKYRPEELYTTHSATIQDEIRRVCEREIEKHHVQFSQILVKDIDLPERVIRAIEEKLVLQQEAEGYDFRLIREDRERLRKKIEAEGLRTYHDTVASGLSNPLLQYLNIQAMRALANSQNAKVVVLGTKGADGISLPLFMDDLREHPKTELPGSPLVNAVAASPETQTFDWRLEADASQESVDMVHGAEGDALIGEGGVLDIETPKKPFWKRFDFLQDTNLKDEIFSYEPAPVVNGVGGETVYGGQWGQGRKSTGSNYEGQSNGSGR